jgi:hypothetical protein
MGEEVTNWIAMPTLTKDLALEWVEMALGQDIPIKLLVWVNGSRETTEALSKLGEPRLHVVHSEENIGVGPSWNRISQCVFEGLLDGSPSDEVLITNDDVKLRPDTLRHLQIPQGGFVTPINVGNWGKCQRAKFCVEEDPIMRGGPDFSCFLLRKWFYEKVGPFPECYPLGYFEDRHFHMQAIGKGLGDQIYSVTFPYYHEGSQTIKRNPIIAAQNAVQFELNKQTFMRLWGGPPHAETRKEPLE